MCVCMYACTMLVGWSLACRGYKPDACLELPMKEAVQVVGRPVFLAVDDTMHRGFILGVCSLCILVLDMLSLFDCRA